MSVATTLYVMAKSNDRHKVPRIPMQIPKPFADVARILAAMDSQPTTWFIMKMIAKIAAEKGVECPPLPWLEDLPEQIKKKKRPS